MQLNSEQLTAHLAQPLKPIYVVYGDEPLLVLEACDEIRRAAQRAGFVERQILTVLSGFNWTELNHVLSERSLFSDRQLIELRIPSGKPGRDGSAALIDYCTRCAQSKLTQALDHVLLISLPGLDWKEEKAPWLSALASTGALIKLVAPTLSALPNWLAARLKMQQQSSDAEGLRFIAERVEGNLLAAHQELQKLALLYPAGRLDVQQIQEAVLNVARYDLDGLRAAFLSGDLARLSRTLDGLRHEGEAPPLILWALCEEIRTLAQLKAGLAAQQPLAVLLREARVWGARQNLLERALERMGTRNAGLAALAHAARIDQMIKGVRKGDVWTEFLRLGLRFSALPAH
ncbi:MAG: DNA polymerase III subunit delta [Pseudomonadota bacterium]